MHAIVTTDCRNKYRSVCVCVCVSGVIEKKGRENGREKRAPKNTLDQRWETFVDFTTRGSSEVKSTCILR